MDDKEVEGTGLKGSREELAGQTRCLHLDVCLGTPSPLTGIGTNALKIYTIIEHIFTHSQIFRLIGKYEFNTFSSHTPRPRS